MSLQVWLPFNRDISNYGLYNTTTRSVNSASIATGGKLGNCLSLSSDGQAVSLDSFMDVCSTYTRYSISAWIYMSSAATNHSSSILSSGNWNSGDSQFCFACYNYFPDGYHKILVPNKSYWSDGIDLGSSIKLNTWYNICITYDGTTTRGYVNGEYVGSYAGGGITASSNSKNLYVGSATYYDGFTLKGSMNDVRIYDHCLSAKEVKEISKGLLCHYKLDNNGFGNPNLITTMSSGGRTTLNGKYGLNADFSQNTDTYGYFNVSPALELDSTYTLSFDVSNFPVGSIWNFSLWNNSNYFIENITKDGHYTYTFVPSESKLPSGYNLTKFLFDDGSRTNPSGVVHFTNFKIEKGNKATPWCPHASDSMYTSLGLDSTTEVDCSGLSNNGTKIGGLTPSTSPISIRYESCYDFDGNTGSIQIPNLATLVPSGEFTMNCWIYHDDTWSSKGYETIFGGPSGFELEAKNTSTNAPVLHAWSWGQGTATYELNKWNMITMTRNSSETKFYINGELKITGSAGTIPSGNYFIGAWNTSSQQNFKGKISDFRLYSTVLSADVIRMLYDTSASIDKNGSMYAYEFKEE